MSKKDKYDELRDKTERIVKEGERLFAGERSVWDDCDSECASCLAATARGNVDEVDFKDSFGMFSSDEDICMCDARDILAEKLNISIY